MENKEKGMITIQMTMEEVMQFGKTVEEVLTLLEDATDAVDELFDMILPVIIEIKKREVTEQPEKTEEEAENEPPCQRCTLPCLANPNYMKGEKAAVPDDDSEEAKAKREEFLRIYEQKLLKDLKDLALRL